METKIMESAKSKWLESFEESDSEIRDMLYAQIDLLRLIHRYIKKYGVDDFKNLMADEVYEVLT